MTMRLCRQAFAVAIIFLATPSVAEPSKRQEPDIDMVALMSGKCRTLKIAGQDSACKSVVYFHSQQGRANFTIVLDDPADDRHMISFSGENGRRDQDNLYELPIDEVLLNSKERPKVDGLREPFIELSTGTCKQLGNFAANQVSSISCTATDKNDKKYELQFESDGVPITVWRIRRHSVMEAKRRAKQVEQLECRHKAAAAQILPRDLTAFLLQCLEEDPQKPTTAEHQ
jgi:hypothetical protein